MVKREKDCLPLPFLRYACLLRLGSRCRRIAHTTVAAAATVVWAAVFDGILRSLFIRLCRLGRLERGLQFRFGLLRSGLRHGMNLSVLSGRLSNKIGPLLAACG